MSQGPQQVGPQEVVPIEALAAAMMGLAVATWQQAEPASPPDESRAARVTALLAATTALTGQPTDEFAQAMAAGDPRVYGALARLEEAAGSAANTLRDRCIRWRREGQWAALRHEAEVFGYLADALRNGTWFCESRLLLARAHRALGDSTGAITSYRTAVKVAAQLGYTAMLAIAYDNLGNVLSDTGELDEALACYARALEYEQDPAGRIAIQQNRANTYVMLGELHTAYRILTGVRAELERSGARGADFGISLDNLASTLLALDEPAAAAELLEQAALEFPPDELGHRAVNWLTRAQACERLSDTAGQEAAFLAAVELADQKARRERDIAHYRTGYTAARRRAVPDRDPAHILFAQALDAKQTEQWGTAIELFQRSAERARLIGDEALALRVEANLVALLADAGQLPPALELARAVRHQASRSGLARPEGMVIGTLASLADRGVDVGELLGAVGLIVTADVLRNIHVQVVTDTIADRAEREFETNDSGALDAQMGKVAQRYRADRLAASRYRVAVETARRHGLRFELVNRLAGLILALHRLGDERGIEGAVAELRPLLDTGALPLRAAIVGWRALASRAADGDPRAAIDQLRRAVNASEQLRQRVAPGAGRASVTAESRDVHYRLADLLRRNGEPVQAFDALQGIKARRFLDVRQVRLGGSDPSQHAAAIDAPATLTEVRQALATLSQDRPSALVDFDATNDGITAYVVNVDGVQVLHVPGEEQTLLRGGAVDVRERELRIVQTCQHDPLLRTLVAQVAAAVPAGSRVLLVPDGYLQNLPLHLVPYNGRPWCEQASIGYLPAAAALRFRTGARSTSTRSFVAGDSKGDLPWAAEECRSVAGLLATEALLQQQCTFAAAREALQGELDVVHLAVHGRSDVRRGGRASLLFADGHGGVEWVPFSVLAALPWRARLVVFSGCGTGVGGRQHDDELAGVAQAAAEAGAPRVLASLWPVDDRATAQFMVAFYRSLTDGAGAAATDLLAVLDAARATLRATSRGDVRRRDGRDIAIVQDPDVQPKDDTLNELLTWGPFVLVGDPVLARR